MVQYRILSLNNPSIFLRNLATEWEDIMTINNWILIYIQENQHKLSYIQIRSPTLCSLSKKTELQLTKN